MDQVGRILCALVPVVLACHAKPATAQAEDAELQRVVDGSIEMLEAYLAAIDPADFELDAAAERQGNDVEALFRFVREAIRHEAYSGALRGAGGCLRSRAGNSVDRALLLADLLVRAGREVRFVRGTLALDQAEVLARSASLDSSFGELDLPYEIDSEALRAERQQSHDALVDWVAERHGRLLEALSDVAERVAEVEPQDGPQQLREHVWVQVRRGEHWLDLDPSWPEAKPGETLCSAEARYAALPDSMWHRVTLRGFVEEIVDGDVRSRTLWTSEHTAAELTGVSVVVDSYRRGATGVLPSLAASLEGEDTHVLGLVLDGRGVASAGFSVDPGVKGRRPRRGGFGGLGRALGRAMGDAPTARLVAVGVEVELAAPGGRRTRLRRYLADDWGFLLRTANDTSKLKNSSTKGSLREAVERTALCFTLETGRVHPAQLQARLLATALAGYRAIRVEGGRFRFDPQATGDAAAWLLGAAYFHIYDRLTDQLLQVDHYAAAPRLVATRFRSGSPATVEVDVSLDRPVFVAVEPARARFEAGLLSAIVEETITVDPLARGDGSGLFKGAAAHFEAALDLGAPLLVAEAAALPRGLPAPLREQLARELDRRWVVLPAGGDPSSWFTFQPRTGELVAWLPNGHHGGAGEYAALNGERGQKDTAAASSSGNAMRGVIRCVAQNLDTIALSALTGSVDALEAAEGAAGCLRKGGGKRAQKRARKERKVRRHGGGRRQIESVAREFKMSKRQRREFGTYVEEAKQSVGRGGNDNLSYQQLRDLAQEFLSR